MKRLLLPLALLYSVSVGASSQISGNVSITAVVQGSMLANNAVNYVGVVGDGANVNGSVSINAVVTESIITDRDGVTKIACVDKDTTGDVNIVVVVSSVVNLGKGEVKVGCSD